MTIKFDSVDEKLYQLYYSNKNALLNNLKSAYYAELDVREKYKIIRKIYEILNKEILETAENCLYTWVNPYFLDWSSHFSPLESSAWHCIRGLGRIVLYPEYPVDKYFLDFANPYLKIGLELDSDKWHRLEKDELRDKRLNSLGWKIFRVRSHETKKYSNILPYDYDYSVKEYEEKAVLTDWMLNSLQGVVYSIWLIYFENHNDGENKELLHLALESLDRHRIVDFDIVNDDFYKFL